VRDKLGWVMPWLTRDNLAAVQAAVESRHDVVAEWALDLIGGVKPIVVCRSATARA
jgi:hypothetical protein